jgi:hypothetical protein
MKVRSKVLDIRKPRYGRGKGRVSMLQLSCGHEFMRINGAKKIGDLQVCEICTDPNSLDAFQQRIFNA